MKTADAVEKSPFEYSYSNPEFDRIRRLVFQHTGIFLSDEKKQLTYSRFSKRIRHLGLAGFGAYLDLVETGDPKELPLFISAITTNFTSFFREPHHFRHLADDVVERCRKSRRIRIWSAGCSTGEEPYSIAITLLESIPNIRDWDVKILATDLDNAVLDAAKSATYRISRLESVPERALSRWFLKGVRSNSGFAKLSPEVTDLIRFKQLNLLDSWPIREVFDVIFCRNVMIYFNKETQNGLFNGFAQRQIYGSTLCIGHSESLSGASTNYRLIGKTIYQRTDQPA